MKLFEVRPGIKCRVKALGPGMAALRRRLLDLGVLSGEPLLVIRKAPLGDPMEIEVEGTRITLRRDEAQKIEVEVEYD